MKTRGIVVLAVAFCLFQEASYAFRPIGHVLLKNRIVASLSKDNKFRIAMEKYPHIAAWGAVGPDLGYNVDLSRIGRWRFKRQIKNSMLMADIAHYHAVGTFTRKLIEEAERQGDEKFYAFVGGWITHIAGDFASHSILVKPEAGHYISCDSTRELHGDLEKLADYVLYKKYTADYFLPEFGYDYYWPLFFGIKADPSGFAQTESNRKLLENMLGGNVNKYFLKVYRETYQLDNAQIDLMKLASTYSRSVGVGWGRLFGFSYDVAKLEAMKSLDATREPRVHSAFDKGIGYGHDFLTRAVTEDRAFSDAWNLDIGENGEPTYVIRIDAAKGVRSRTKNDIVARFINVNGTSSPPIRLNTHLKSWDFIFYQEDAYYYALNLGGKMGDITGWNSDNIKSVELFLQRGTAKEDSFFAKKVTIYYNGQPLASVSGEVPIELTQAKPIRFLLKT